MNVIIMHRCREIFKYLVISRKKTSILLTENFKIDFKTGLNKSLEPVCINRSPLTCCPWWATGGWTSGSSRGTRSLWSRRGVPNVVFVHRGLPKGSDQDASWDSLWRFSWHPLVGDPALTQNSGRIQDLTSFWSEWPDHRVVRSVVVSHLVLAVVNTTNHKTSFTVRIPLTKKLALLTLNH